MLVVMALVGILSGIIGVAIMMARQSAIRITCSENLHGIGTQLQGILLSDGGDYPALYENQDGDSIPVYGAGNWDGGNGIPWWARVHKTFSGAAKLDREDPATPTPAELDLPRPLPDSLRVFHCRAAPPLKNPAPSKSNKENVVALDHSISYGLNFDVMRDDSHNTTHYQCVDKSNPNYPDLDALAEPTDAADRKPDRLRWADIKNPAEFVILTEADSEHQTGGRVRCEATQDSGSDEAHVVGRHGGKANVLFADNHVESWDVLEHAATWAKDINKNTPLWTLPND